MTEAIQAAQEILALETKQFFKDLANRVRWCDHEDIPLDLFHSLFLLVVYDLFGEKDDEELAELVNGDVNVIRNTPDYKAVEHNVRQQFEYLKNPKEFKDHIADAINQDRLARAGLRRALYADNPQHANKAMEILADRAMPRVTEKQGARVTVLSEGAARLLLQAEKETKVIEAEYTEVGEHQRDREGSSQGNTRDGAD